MSKRTTAFALAFPLDGAAALFEPGEVRLALLSLLTDMPKHGYQLMKELQDIAPAACVPRARGALSDLQQLEQDENGRGRDAERAGACSG